MSSVLNTPFHGTTNTRYGRSHSDSMANSFVDQTPRTLAPVDPIVRKRKLDLDNDYSHLATPMKANFPHLDLLITPPGDSYYKRSKTVPSSPISQSYLATPNTPISKLSFNGNLSTPPSSAKGSPELNKRKLHKPHVASTVNSFPGYSNFFGDTCYSFNLSSSSLNRSNESNVRASNWRDACQDKIKHEFNKQYKKFQQLSVEFNQKALERYKSKSNPPPLFEPRMFPYINKLHDFVGNQYENHQSLVNYPFTMNEQQQQDNFERDYEVLLHNPDLNIGGPPRYIPLIEATPNITLPPISEILKVSAMDKAGVHPLGLTNSEMNCYNDLSKYSVTLGGDSKQYYSNHFPTRSKKKPIQRHLGNDMFPEDNYVQYDNSIDYSQQPALNVKPIANPSFIHDHMVLPLDVARKPTLKITKTRKVSNSSKIGKKPNSRKSSTSQRGRQQNKRRSSSKSRSLSPSKPRTRSSSRSQFQEDMTVEFQSSTSTTTSPKSKIYQDSLSNESISTMDTEPLVSPSKASVSEETLLGIYSQQNIINDHQHHHSHSTKKCLSCGSSNSPCWRPSWNPELGQLCNSCGLRYRKTKARCMNSECLRIPAKSEWSLMQRRGKSIMVIKNEMGEELETHCYKCLQCDHGMEVKI